MEFVGAILLVIALLAVYMVLALGRSEKASTPRPMNAGFMSLDEPGLSGDRVYRIGKMFGERRRHKDYDFPGIERRRSLDERTIRLQRTKTKP